MGKVKNLMNENAIIKMRELARKARSGFFQTDLTDFPCKGRPMTVLEIDDEGRLWFISQASSNKNEEIRNDNHVEIVFARPDSAEFLCVFGTAEILYDRKKIDQLWDPFLRTWFPKGKDDSDVSLICVKPIQAHYWDIKHNKAVALLKSKIAELVGIAADNGVEGALRV
jgi:general stress protein 26